MKASYERPLSRADLIALLWHFAGSPYRDRLEQIAAHDAAQREIIDAQAREIARLAAEPETKHPGHNRIGELETLLRECNAVCLCGCPDAEHEADECGESCGHDDHECIRVAKAVLAYVERLRSAAPPAGAEVREAAEVLAEWDKEEVRRASPSVRRLVRALSALAVKPSAQPAGDAVREALAEIVEWSAREAPCACNVDSPVECWLCRWHSRATAVLAARPAVVDGAAVREAAESLETWTDPATGDQYAHGRCVGAPASAGIGEAAKIIRRIVTNHDARITERGVLVYGRPSVSTGFVDAIEWLRRYDAALRGGQKGGE